MPWNLKLIQNNKNTSDNILLILPLVGFVRLWQMSTDHPRGKLICPLPLHQVCYIIYHEVMRKLQSISRKQKLNQSKFIFTKPISFPFSFIYVSFIW